MTALDRARTSLEGLSVGDAFGERFFVQPNLVELLIARRIVPDGDWGLGRESSPEPMWPFTDDTNMALSVYACLAERGEIDSDWLAVDFAARYDPYRGYGAAMHGYLARIRDGADWRVEAPRLFGGHGSFGNGAAMRVAPVGAYFADDLDAVVENARRSAEVTHAHPEGVAGAIAVAVASAWAWRLRQIPPLPRERDFLDLVLPLVPESEVREGVLRARDLASGTLARRAASVLGSGDRVSAQDTVPFALWCAGLHLDNYEEALWLTVSGLGDRDTTCAIVGGIVASHSGVEGIPSKWLNKREPIALGCRQE